MITAGIGVEPSFVVKIEAQSCKNYQHSEQIILLYQLKLWSLLVLSATGSLFIPH